MTEKQSTLWLVSELYYPEETSTGYFVTRIAEGLAKYRTVVAVGSKPTYSERALDVAWQETRNGVDIRRIRSTRFDKDSIPGRIANFITFTLGAGWHLLRKVRRGDVVLVLTNPPFMPLIAGLVARLRGARCILLVHDMYPDVLVATGHLSADSMMFGLLRRIFDFTFRLFDRVVVLGRDMQQRAADKLGNAGRQPDIIPNWGDSEEIVPKSRHANAFAIEFGLTDKTVIQFSGNLGRTHDLETVLAAAKIVRDQPDIIFLFVGYGGKAELVMHDQNARPFDNIMALPRQPRARLADMLACSDATIIAFVDAMYGVSVPSRMYNVMAAGVPILAMCDDRSELACTVVEENCGWVLDIGDVDALVEQVRMIHSARTNGTGEAAQRGANGRRAAEQRFTQSAVVGQFRQLLDDIDPSG